MEISLRVHGANEVIFKLFEFGGFKIKIPFKFAYFIVT